MIFRRDRQPDDDPFSLTGAANEPEEDRKKSGRGGCYLQETATPVMTAGHLVFSVTTTLYILVAVKFLEERDLEKIHGETYVEYQQNVPMLI
ncbi:MAG: hypothetical protein WD317_05360, partial [Balneolaceae bacterium]